MIHRTAGDRNSLWDWDRMHQATALYPSRRYRGLAWRRVVKLWIASSRSVRGDIHMYYSPAIMSQRRNSTTRETCCGNREKVDGRRLAEMILEKCLPIW